MKSKFTFLLSLAAFFTTTVFAQSSFTFYVSAANGNDANLGNSPSQAFKTLHRAIIGMRVDGITDNITIRVEKGTYYPYDGNASAGVDAAFLMCRDENTQAGKKLKILGGYDFTTGTRDIANNPTILDGGGQVNHVVVVGNVSSDADSLEISGFTITGAVSTGGEIVQYVPGTIAINRSSGGGISIETCTSNKILIRNCVIKGNTSYLGAGLTSEFVSGATIANCVFENNKALYSPGLADQNGRVIGTARGGAISCLNSNLKLLGCIFYNNNATYGSAIEEDNYNGETLAISNCTFFNNRFNSSSIPYCIFLEKAGRLELTNSVFWKNRYSLGDESIFYLNGTVASDQDEPYTGSIYVTNNQLESSADSKYNCGFAIGGSPEQGPFVNANQPAGADGKWMTADDGLQLNICLDPNGKNYGNNSFPGASLPADITGRTRIVGSRVDFGAYEDQLVNYNYYPDADGDGHGSVTAFYTRSCVPIAGYTTNNDDCDDADSSVHPGAREICDDGKDNDCNGKIDDALPDTYYPDADGDGYGQSNGQPVVSCKPVTGYATNNKDCNDKDKTIYPGAPELCDDKDNNCNGQIDEGITKPTWYLDADGDGWGNAAVKVVACTAPQGYVSQFGDCDDKDNTTHPGAREICNDGKDNNCNGIIDTDVVLILNIADNDGDGYGDANAPFVLYCDLMPGYSSVGGDCDDKDKTIYPGAPEICDEKDNNCDGQVDEGFSKTTYYLDADGDGYGDATHAIQACSQPTNYVSDNTDCDDSKKAINPTTVWYKDADGDGYSDGSTRVQCLRPAGYKLAAELTATSGDCRDDLTTVHPNAVEICDNNIDDNCNGQIDEACPLKVNVQPASTTEGNSGKHVMYVTIQLTKPAPGKCEVDYFTRDLTAKAGSDYQHAKGRLSFSKGQSAKTIAVEVFGDKTVEGNEQFQVVLEKPKNVAIGTSTATGTILNDDGTTTMTVAVDLNTAIEEPLVVPNLLHRSQIWRIPSLPGTNEVIVTDMNGKVVLQARNYQNKHSFSNVAAGIYFYQIQITDSDGKPKLYRGKMLITD